MALHQQTSPLHEHQVHYHEMSAFSARGVVELKQRDKSKIESILLHGDQLLVGLSTGSLRIYRVNDDGTSDLLREHEKFSKYKIDQLAVFKEANVLVSLSNAICSLHDLNSYDLQEQLVKTKGATLFAVTSNIVSDDNVPVLVSKLAVAVKRRLLLWTWHDGEVSADVIEIPLASSIKSLTWSTGTKIVAGLTNHYVLVDVESKEIKPIVGPGSIGGEGGQESKLGSGTMSYIGMGSMIPVPLATGLGENEMLLARDINTHFIDRDGEPIGRRQIPWRASPEAIGYSYPYLLALVDSKLEIRNPQTLTVLQSIDLSGVNKIQVPNPTISLAHLAKGFLVASDRAIWRMSGLGYNEQIKGLVEDGNFDEAVSLLGMIEETLVEDKAGQLRQIKMMKAQRLFDEKRYRDSLDLFVEVTSPPNRVIQLYPEVISGELAGSRPPSPVKSHKKTASTASAKSQVKDTDQHSINGGANAQDPLTDKELKNAVRELQGFLADIRRRLQRFFNTDQSVKDLSDLTLEDRELLLNLLDIKSLEHASDQITDLARLVDTTLFRAHMYATPSLAGSLFRISNFCDPEVVMTKLEESGRQPEMIDFLFGKRLHRQALERLQRLGKAEDADESLRGPTRTIAYLQNLPPEMIYLILEFAKWPLEADPDLAMQIFLADTENAESLPRNQVLNFLESIDTTLALQYLEHVISELNDSSPELHQKLLLLYLAALKEHSTARDTDILDKFLQSLRESTQYSPNKILELLPNDDDRFDEARAILYRRLGRHKEALQIYVYKLHDHLKAEEYCNQVYMTQSDLKLPATRRMSTHPVDEAPSIYQVLLNLYLYPPKGEKPMLVPAIEIMTRHGARLPASSTLDMIPEDLLVKELEFYFRGRIRNANTVMKETTVVAGLRKVDAIHLSAALELGEDVSSGGRARKFLVDEDRVCGICHKRLGNSVISCFPE